MTRRTLKPRLEGEEGNADGAEHQEYGGHATNIHPLYTHFIGDVIGFNIVL
jgi:hypothetical protein